MLKTLMKMCFVASVVLVIGCSSGTVSSGVSDSAVYSQEEADDIFNNAPEGSVGTYSRASASNEQRGFIKCKVDFVYMYSTYTYVTLKGCAWKFIKLTGSLRTQGAAVAVTAKSRNMFFWIWRTSRTRFSYVVV
jgi:hypothetical protein